MDSTAKYPERLFQVVLIEPLIPQNTGNIGRTCIGYWSSLHLVEPMAFEVNDKNLKRAGLDYWPNLEFHIHKNFEDWWQNVNKPKRVFFLETKSDNCFYDYTFEKGDWFVFGNEAPGIPQAILERFPDQVLTIPFPGKIRSFNVANTVSMVLSEGARQLRQRGEWSPQKDQTLDQNPE